MCVCLPSHLSRVRLFATPWTIARQAPLSTGFSRQGYWSGLLPSPPGDLSDPGIEPESLTSTCIGRRVLYHWLYLGSPSAWAAAAAKLLQSCLTLCNPIDGSQPGSPKNLQTLRITALDQLSEGRLCPLTHVAAATAKSLQSRPTLCNPMD